MLFQVALLASGLQLAAAASRQSICSAENTGSDFTAVTNIYNSISACEETCGSTYTFSVLQDANCWCTNSEPKTSLDISECSTACPGYPSDSCGSTTDGYYTYISSGSTTSGTNSSDASSSSSASSSSASSSSTVSFTPLNGTSSGNSTSSSGNGTVSSSSKPSTSSGVNSDGTSAAVKVSTSNMATMALAMAGVAAFFM